MELQEEKPRIHLYLDDVRPCPPGFVLAQTADECIQLLGACNVDILSLDYDLGWSQATGLHVARSIAANSTGIRFPKEIYLHSSSAIGRLSMFQALYPHKPPNAILVNGPMPIETLNRVAQS